jgi:small-conductance mechanosensitive channel
MLKTRALIYGGEMNITYENILTPAIVAVFSILVFFVVRRIIFRFLRRWIEKSETRLGDIIVSSVKTPSILWCIAIGMYLGLDVSEAHHKYVVPVSRIIHIIVIFSITAATANLIGKLFRNYIQKTDLPLPTTGLAYGILKGVIYMIGVLIILGALGVSIAPLVTALGIGGLAVALALKDTLANLFAGIHIMVEKSIRIGDFIKLESGQEGCVEDITWRTTRVRMLPNNMVVIPNDKLSQSVVTNYSLPERTMSVPVAVGVGYSSDPDHVERILVEEARKAVGEVPGLLGAPEPSVKFIPGFGESSLNFTLFCQVREFADQGLVQSELRKRILKRFREERIEMPFPQRTVYVREEKDWK